LLAIAKQVGFTQQTFDECLSNQKLLDGLEEVRKRGSDKFNIQSTPTFFINGERLVGAQPLAEFEKVIEKYLKS
jgi:protein-disulfide isomerase